MTDAPVDNQQPATAPDSGPDNSGKLDTGPTNSGGSGKGAPDTGPSTDKPPGGSGGESKDHDPSQYLKSNDHGDSGGPPDLPDNSLPQLPDPPGRPPKPNKGRGGGSTTRPPMGGGGSANPLHSSNPKQGGGSGSSGGGADTGKSGGGGGSGGTGGGQADTGGGGQPDSSDTGSTGDQAPKDRGRDGTSSPEQSDSDTSPETAGPKSFADTSGTKQGDGFASAYLAAPRQSDSPPTDAAQPADTKQTATANLAFSIPANLDVSASNLTKSPPDGWHNTQEIWLPPGIGDKPAPKPGQHLKLDLNAAGSDCKPRHVGDSTSPKKPDSTSPKKPEVQPDAPRPPEGRKSRDKPSQPGTITMSNPLGKADYRAGSDKADHERRARPKAGWTDRGAHDMHAPPGTPVYSPVDGKITWIHPDSGRTGMVFGDQVTIHSGNGEAKFFLTHIELDPQVKSKEHLADLRHGKVIEVHAGQRLGEVVEWVDEKKGIPKDSHLHIGMAVASAGGGYQAVDPTGVMAATKGGVTAREVHVRGDGTHILGDGTKDVTYTDPPKAPSVPNPTPTPTPTPPVDSSLPGLGLDLDQIQSQ